MGNTQNINPLNTIISKITPNKIQFKIIITKEYKIKCSWIDSEKKETTININNKETEYYPINISFINNKIVICQENTNENTVLFFEEWINQPHEFKEYKIHYQNKEYILIAEVLFALILKEFTSQIEKEYIIEKTEIQLPKENKEFNFRILTALDSIGLKDIELEEEDIEYEYKNQGEILNEIIEKNESYRKRERMIERAKEINKEMKINEECLINEEEYEKEIKKYSVEERSK